MIVGASMCEMGVVYVEITSEHVADAARLDHFDMPLMIACAHQRPGKYGGFRSRFSNIFLIVSIYLN